MSTLLENAKKSAYTAVGLQVLMLDEVNERVAEQFASQRKQLEAQLKIARKHGLAARKDWEKQIAPLTTRMNDVNDEIVKRFEPVTTKVTELNEQLQERFEPVAKASRRIVEPSLKQIADLGERLPAPVAKVIEDSLSRTRELLGADETVAAAKPAAPKAEAAVAAKPAARKPVARKAPAARRPATRKPAARKAPAA